MTEDIETGTALAGYFGEDELAAGRAWKLARALRRPASPDRIARVEDGGLAIPYPLGAVFAGLAG